MSVSSLGWLSKMAARSNQSCTHHPMHLHGKRASPPTMIEKILSFSLATFEPVTVTKEIHTLTGLGLKIITVIWEYNHCTSRGEDEVSLGKDMIA